VIAQELAGRSANAVRNRYLRCLPQDGALKTPRPKVGPSPSSYYHGAAQPRLGQTNPNNAPHRPTVHAPLQQTRAAAGSAGTRPPRAAARAREEGLHLMGRAPPQPPPKALGRGFSLDEFANIDEFDADIQRLLGSDVAREAERSTAEMTTGPFG
jgi:hypothetical protein